MNLLINLYALIGDFFLTILVFSLMVRIVLFPMYFKSHKNSIKLLNLQPKINKIKRIHAGNREASAEAQAELFKAENYKPLLSSLPLFAQLGVLMLVITIIQHTIAHVYLGFWGEHSFVMPIISGLSALLFCLIQNKITPGALSQGKGTNFFLTAFTVAFSAYFAAVTPAAVGLYWTVSNAYSIGVIYLLNKVYSPTKHAGQALQEIKKQQQTKKEKVTRKQDVAAFNKAQKRLVFYALSGGQYKYYQNIIEYILNNSQITIHYLTNDPHDKVLNQQSQRFIPYYISQQRTITTLLRLECDILVTTVQDLQVYHMKRSVAKDDIEYIHIVHGMASLHMTAREEAYDHFDTFFAVGQHQINEIREREKLANLPPKRLVKAGYGLYDQLVSAYDSATNNQTKQILIAPSWQENNLLDNGIEQLIEALASSDFTIIVRPHPQYVGVFPERIEELRQRYPSVVFDTNFLGSDNIFQSDYIVTDWSGIAFEFSFCTLKPSIFINTPMKVLNPNYKDYDVELTDVTWREKVGVSLELQDINKIVDILADFPERDIKAVVKEYIFYPGRNGEAGGRYIINQLEA